MEDAIELIYFYKLGAEGFRRGSLLNNNTYELIINDALRLESSRCSLYNFKATPEKMSEIILYWLREDV